MYVCMYVCIYVCVCVMQTTMNFCACMGAQLLGKLSVWLCRLSVCVCVCVRVCQWVLLCECVCECVCATASLRLSRQGQREIRRCCCWQTSSGSSAISCVCKLRMCWCVRVTGANPASKIIICINKRTFSFFFLCVPLSRLSNVAVVDDCCCCCCCCHFCCCCCCYCDVFVTNCFQVVFYFINCRRNHVWNVLTIQLRHTKHNFFDFFNKNQCIIHFLASYFLFSFLCCFFFH